MSCVPTLPPSTITAYKTRMSLARASFQREFQLAWIKPKLNFKFFSQSFEKDLAVIAGSCFDTDTSCLFSRAAEVPGGARLPERLQQQSHKKSRRWVMAALHGISSPQLGLILVMGSYYDLAGTTKWLNWFLGLIRQGAARSYFGFTAYFSRHSRKGGADPFLQISPTSVHNSGSLYFYMQDEGWHCLAGIFGFGWDLSVCNNRKH